MREYIILPMPSQWLKPLPGSSKYAKAHFLYRLLYQASSTRRRI